MLVRFCSIAIASCRTRPPAGRKSTGSIRVCRRGTPTPAATINSRLSAVNTPLRAMIRSARPVPWPKDSRLRLDRARGNGGNRVSNAGTTPRPVTRATIEPNAPANPNCRTGPISLTCREASPIEVVRVARQHGFHAKRNIVANGSGSPIA